MEHDYNFPDADPDQHVMLARINAIICTLVANELDVIRARIELMGESLCSEPVFVREHSETLQAIDEISQRHENLARLLRAGDMEVAIDSITLENLRNQLLDAVTDLFVSAEETNEDDLPVNWLAV